MMKTNIKKLAAMVIAAAMSASMMMPAYAETTGLEAINAATRETIATAVSQYVVEVGKTDPYGVLPECDQNEINGRILENAPYSSDEELAAAFQTALEYTTQVDKDWYDTVLLEDFSTGKIDTTVWSVPEKSPFITNKNITSTVESKSLNISGTDDMSMAVWGKSVTVTTDDAGTTQTGGKQYLQKKITDPNVIITGYFYNTRSDAVNTYYEFRINGKNGYRVGGFETKKNYVYSIDAGTTWKKIKPLDTAWHKVEFDGATKPGYVTGYFDGVEIFTVAATIEELYVGTFSSLDNFTIFFTDNITIAKPKSNADFLADLNSKELTESNVKRATRFIGQSEPYASLPECDRIEIAERLEAGRPYASIDDLTAAYQTALEYTTGVDEDNYTEAWSEDFSQGLDAEKWTTGGTLVEGAVGEAQPTGIGDVRKSLNISGTEDASLGIFGASTAGSANYVTRTVENSKSIVTVYFYDLNNDVSYPRFGVYLNDDCAITRSDASGYYGYFVNGVGNASSITATQGWHKVVFDGLTDETGLVTAYLDGNEIFQTDKPIEKIQVGNSFGVTGYGVFWVDNISVATEKLAEKVTITNRGNEITDGTLPANATVIVQIENWEKTTDYIVAAYKDEQLVNVTLLTKEGDVELAKVATADIDDLKVFCWDDITTMKAVGDMIHLTKAN